MLEIEYYTGGQFTKLGEKSPLAFQSSRSQSTPLLPSTETETSSCRCGGLQESSLHSPCPKQVCTSVKFGSHFVYGTKVTTENTLEASVFLFILPPSANFYYWTVSGIQFKLVSIIYPSLFQGHCEPASPLIPMHLDNSVCSFFSLVSNI